jgi:hypothetical protein
MNLVQAGSNLKTGDYKLDAELLINIPEKQSRKLFVFQGFRLN